MTKPSTALVDLLYVDAIRIRSYLSQLQEFGVLDELVRSGEESSGEKRRFSGKAGISLIEAGGENEFVNEEGSKEERRYDVRHTLPLAFLRLLKVHKLLKENVEEARIGEIITSSGTLSILETTLQHRIYGEESLRDIFLERSEKRFAEEGNEWSKESALVVMKMIEALPSQVHAILATENYAIWSSLRPESMTTPASELNMKYGVTLDGSWKVLGIKDASPSKSPERDQKNAENLARIYQDAKLVGEAINLITGLRGYMGRPYSAYGITPIMIYRDVV